MNCRVSPRESEEAFSKSSYIFLKWLHRVAHSFELPVPEQKQIMKFHGLFLADTVGCFPELLRYILGWNTSIRVRESMCSFLGASEVLCKDL